MADPDVKRVIIDFECSEEGMARLEAVMADPVQRAALEEDMRKRLGRPDLKLVAVGRTLAPKEAPDA